jgi:hypothetical protein
MEGFERMHIEINTSSPAYRRMTCAGWKIMNARAIEEDHGISLRVDFNCVCGRLETFNYMIQKKEMEYGNPFFENGKWDCCQQIENFGATSVEHIRNDGFTEEQIKQIRYVYDLEDEVKELRRFKAMHEALYGIMPDRNRYESTLHNRY